MRDILQNNRDTLNREKHTGKKKSRKHKNHTGDKDCLLLCIHYCGNEYSETQRDHDEEHGDNDNPKQTSGEWYFEKMDREEDNSHKIHH